MEYLKKKEVIRIMGIAIGFLIGETLIGTLHGVPDDAIFIAECVLLAAIAICRSIEKR